MNSLLVILCGVVEIVVTFKYRCYIGVAETPKPMYGSPGENFQALTAIVSETVDESSRKSTKTRY